MANIGIRSPYFVYYTETAQVGGLNASYATLSLTIAGTLEYSITKYTGTSFLMDISELIRDFVNPVYSGVIDKQSAKAVVVSYSLQFYTLTGASVGAAKTNTHTAFDAYNYFKEGNSIDSNESGFDMPAYTIMLSGPVIWYPENTAGSFFYIDASAVFQKQDFGVSDSRITMFTGTAYERDIYIRRLPCSKYAANRVVFINKYGVLQEMWFTAKTTESLSVFGEKFKSGFVSQNGAINRFKHQVADYNKNGKIRYTLNTTYICEGVTRYIEELMLSELVWMQINGDYFPVNVTTSDVQYKNSVNDKLVNYTIEVEQANDLISTVR
jgi:hypothetical protein